VARFELAAGENTAGVAVHQYGQQGGWVVRLGAASGVLPRQIAQVELVNHLHDEARQVAFV